MNDNLPAPPGRLIRPEGKNVPTHDEYGDPYDQMNASKGFIWCGITSIVIFSVTVASCTGYL